MPTKEEEEAMDEAIELMARPGGLKMDIDPTIPPGAMRFDPGAPGREPALLFPSLIEREEWLAEMNAVRREPVS